MMYATDDFLGTKLIFAITEIAANAAIKHQVVAAADDIADTKPRTVTDNISDN